MSTILATVDFRTTTDPERPESLPESAWDALYGAIGVAMCTGSRGAFTTDPKTGVKYHATQRYEDRAGIRTGTAVFDISVVEPEPEPAPVDDHTRDVHRVVGQAKLDEVLTAAQAAQDAALGDSNDQEIELLRDALDVALGALGLDLPEGREPRE